VSWLALTKVRKPEGTDTDPFVDFGSHRDGARGNGGSTPSDAVRLRFISRYAASEGTGNVSWLALTKVRKPEGTAYAPFVNNRARGDGCEIGLHPAMRSILVLKFVRVERIYFGYEIRFKQNEFIRYEIRSSRTKFMYREELPRVGKSLLREWFRHTPVPGGTLW
jgi:hypothetical protein